MPYKPKPCKVPVTKSPAPGVKKPMPSQNNPNNISGDNHLTGSTYTVTGTKQDIGTIVFTNDK